MNWRKPQTDEEWREALSAYLDGELTNDERAAFDLALKVEPRWADELTALRRMGTALHEWEVSIPENAKRDLIERLAAHAGVRESANRSESALRRVFNRLPAFTAGALSGAAAVLAVVFAHPAGLAPQRPTAPSVAFNADVTISDGQADSLLREVAAGNLKQAVLSRQLQRDWAGAEKAYEQLRREYADTAALRELKDSGALRPLERYRSIVERKGKNV